MKKTYQTGSFSVVEYEKDVITTSGFGKFNTDWLEDKELDDTEEIK